MTPVRPSASTVAAPGTGVDTAGRPLSPASMSTPGMPSPVGRLVNTSTSARRRSSGTSEREPRSSTPWAAAGPASGPASGPSPTTMARNERPSARRRPTTSTKRSGCFWGVMAPTKMSVATAVGRCRPRMELRRISSVRYHDRPMGGHSETPGAFIEHLVADRHHQIRPGHETPPYPQVEWRRRSRVGTDDAVGQRAPGADDCRHDVLHRVAAMGHHHRRVQTCERRP